MTAPRTFSVEQYCASVRKLVRDQIPPVWVRGVLVQVNPRGKMVYLRIADFADGSHKPDAALDLVIFGSDYEGLRAKLSSGPRPFELAPDLKVCLLLQADFYAPQGKFQPRIVDIDPSYTLGELARNRMLILQRLQAEGLLRANAALRLPMAPLRVGLVTARESAAEHDFRQVMESSGYAVEIVSEDARMQGAETEATVIAALGRLAVLDLDCCCIVRGGGSRTDLVWFDSEAICRAIANHPTPVLTGIGHEIDRSLADEVAWRDCITPTACARFLVDQFDQAMGATRDAALQLERGWRRRREEARRLLVLLREGLRRTAQSRGQRESLRVAELARLLGPRLRRRLEREGDRLRADAHGLVRGSAKILDRDRAVLIAREQLVRVIDPVRILERGFTLTRDAASGRVLRATDLATLTPGADLLTQFAAGSVRSKVAEIEMSQGPASDPAPNPPLDPAQAPSSKPTPGPNPDLNQPAETSP
jgi:exodeoxyribonuclease VII large subunit